MKSKARGRDHFEPPIACRSACQREHQSRSLQRLSLLIKPPLSELRLQAEAIFVAVQLKCDHASNELCDQIAWSLCD